MRHISEDGTRIWRCPNHLLGRTKPCAIHIKARLSDSDSLREYHTETRHNCKQPTLGVNELCNHLTKRQERVTQSHGVTCLPGDDHPHRIFYLCFLENTKPSLVSIYIDSYVSRSQLITTFTSTRSNNDANTTGGSDN